MNKKLILFFILAVAASIFINVTAGSWISAQLSSIPFFEKYHILNPQAPIVITRREEVKSGDSGEMLDALNRAKSRLSAIVTLGENSVAVNGGAVNLSADGYFLTVQQAIANMSIGNDDRHIILNNGQQAPITLAWGETGTNLVIVKADLSNVPAVEFGSSESLQAGDNLGFAHSAGSDLGAMYFQESFVTAAQNVNAGKVFSADKPSRSFGAQSAGGLIPGEAVINSDGKVVGIWDGQTLVSSDVINETVRAFFGGGQKLIERPQWRFSYRNIGATESGLFKLPLGALVMGVESPGPAAAAGLKAGDSITAVGGQNISDDTSLEELLQGKKPGQAVGFTIVRDKKLMTLNVMPGI